jgi:hypothetical protein
MLHKFRIALAATLMALAAVSAIDSASACTPCREAANILKDPTADNTDVWAFSGAP